ncbi:Vacuolar proton pump d subunit, putative [Acanthamoeba castellanii str. Neff]|uniref:Vacuolar proton pump d subunit, putative n=1 Tax=Acanthamoeba castellanii (strain ATCC 30010 / Neff) TaxID=1257118 RepID=L8H122_ACACF|nr:Vacuolar proton pump d subunit, putative [Acanthamoeba castellanii str. Neff]ELR18922.1 Vacuolar proton pump d subunit, putative [Acanthamoeba castellanii str. Neff]
MANTSGLYGYYDVNPMRRSIMTFNIDDGFPEAIVRGYRSGILTPADYANLTQCESLEDMKLHLASTDYGDFLQNEPSPIHTTTIAEKCTQKLIEEFQYVRANCFEPLSTFLDYISFLGCLSQEDLNEMNIELIRNTLYKAYLQDFYRYCQVLGGDTAEVMGEILQFEADRRAINITINSFGTELRKEEREALYPNFGLLYPEGTKKLGQADRVDQVKDIVDTFSNYGRLFDESGHNSDKSLEDAFFAYEVKLNQLSFDRQMQYGVFYAYIKLKEQEIRNLVWIAECISQQLKSKINNYIPIFKD